MRTFTLLVLLLIYTGITMAQSKDQMIMQILEEAYQPGLTLAYFEDGKIVESKAFGYQSTDRKTPVTENTVFSAASLSKPILAYLVLQMADQGTFDLDKPLLDYYQYGDILEQEQATLVTARMVLSHQSGLPNWRRGGPLAFTNAPGTKFGYSGEAFEWLQHTIEHLSGKNLEALAKEKIFHPFGMSRTSFVWQDHFETDYAIPHNNIGKSWRKSKGTKPSAAHSLQTTASDYARFLMALAEGTGLSSTSLQEMLHEQVLVEEKPEIKGSVHWGLGVGLQETSAGKEFWHWGDNGTFKAYFTVSPEQKKGMVYFANSQNGLSFTPELVQLYMETSQPGWIWNGYDHYQSPAFQMLPKVLASSFQEVISNMKQQGFLDDLEERNITRFAGRLSYEKRLVDAEATLRYGLTRFPESKAIQEDLASLLMNDGRTAAAQEVLQILLKKNPDASTAKELLQKISTPSKGGISIQFHQYPTAKMISLVGDFNKWESNTHLFRWEDGFWTCRFDLEPGTYHYQIVVDGVRILDPNQSETGFKDGKHFSILQVK